MRTCPTCGADVAPDARFCAACGTPLEAAADAVAAEERKLVTVLFADVTGSTELGEQLDPERLRAVLHRYFTTMSAAIAAWGGTVEKYIGDAIMAVFGVPVAREDDAERALHAALEMLERLTALNAELRERYAVELRIRIGINTGEVVAPLEARPAGQQLVAGDAVNVAARLEAAAEPGEILAGERTYLAARQAFAFGEAIPLTLKGKAQPVPARRVVEALPDRERGLPGLAAPMIGRDRELGTLTALLDEAAETRQPRLVVIYGTAGIGKSRLVRELVVSAAQRNDQPLVLRGRCLSAGRGITFWALGELLRSATAISLQDPVEDARQRLESSVRDTLEGLGLGESEIAETVHALALTAGIRLPANPLEQVPPTEVADAMARAWPRYAAGLSRRSPAVLVIEDLHWADEPMLDLLTHIATRAIGPIQLVVTSRPEFAEHYPSFAANAEAAVISLRPLTEGQGRELIDRLLDVDQLPDALRADIVSRAEGNPLFVEELLRRLIDESVIVHRDGRWVATSGAADVLLPDTIHALLAARLDGLPSEEKRVMQEAAVIGRGFWASPIASAVTVSTEAPAAVDTVRPLLERLERRGLIVARPTSTLPGEVEYAFRHALIRDVAYASVPRSRRARAHAEVAEWMERLAGERTDEVAELLAYHYYSAIAGDDADLAWSDDPDGRASVRRRAFDTLVVAGAALRGRNAVDKAIELHQRALSLSTDDGERFSALEELGDDHAANFRGDDCLDAYLAAIDLVDGEPLQPAAFGRITVKIADMARRFGAFTRPVPSARVEDLVSRALGLTRDPALRSKLLAAHASLGHLWAIRGLDRSDRSAAAAAAASADNYLQAATEALNIADQLNDPDLIYRATDAASALYWTMHNAEGYFEMARRQLELLPQLPSTRLQAEIAFTSSTARLEAGDPPGALDLGERAIILSRDLSGHDRMHASFATMQAAFELGAWARVLELFGPHRELEPAEGNVSCSAVRGGPLLGAVVMIERGDRETALRLVPPEGYEPDQTPASLGWILLFFARVLDDPEFENRWLDVWLKRHEESLILDGGAEVITSLARRSRWGDVRRWLPAVHEAGDMKPIHGAAAHRAEGLLLAVDGDPAGARQHLAESVRIYDRVTSVWEAAQTRELLAEQAPEEAAELLAAALATYEKLGARPRADALRARLST